MNSSKSMNLIAAVHNYKSKGDDVLVFKPSIDTRSSTGYVESRTGIKTECIDIDSRDSIYLYVKNQIGYFKRNISCVFIEECQFLTISQTWDLIYIVNDLNIPVLAYGLRTDFAGGLFPASNLLMRHADKIEEIKTVCNVQGCNSKALYNQRLVNGKPTFKGESVVIGDTKEAEVSYLPTCRHHYFEQFNANDEGC
jgi:thymidine kinase